MPREIGEATKVCWEVFTEIDIHAEFTKKMFIELCEAKKKGLPESTITRFISICRKYGTIMSGRAKKSMVHRKLSNISWNIVINSLKERGQINYKKYIKAKKDKIKAAKEEMIYISAYSFEAIKETIVEQHYEIIEFEKKSKAADKELKSLRGAVKVLEQQIVALKKSCEDKVSEIEGLTLTLKRYKTLAKKNLKPADLSFFESLGRNKS